ncbi:MAG: hypothetical protein AAGF98_13225 [Cyanobacteria bacterium P01_H01_bin.153]
MDGAHAPFRLDETDWGHVLEVKQPVSGLAMNGSGICGTTWGLRIRPTPVIEQLKKNIVIWNPLTGALESPVPPPLVVGQVRIEMDETRKWGNWIN